MTSDTLATTAYALKIIQRVAKKHKVNVSVILGTLKDKQSCAARHEAIREVYAAMDGRWSKARIGRLFYRSGELISYIVSPARQKKVQDYARAYFVRHKRPLVDD